jgi:hypothetical protein
MPAEHPFVKDLGYLEPFLQRLKAYAAQLPDPKARERLGALMDEQLTRWPEIRALLEAPSASAALGAPARSGAPAGPGAAQRTQQPDRSRTWTIGPLTDGRRT